MKLLLDFTIQMLRKLEYQKRQRSSQTLVQLAEDLISQAMKCGEFDNLKGTGQPLKYATQNPYIDTHTKYLNDFLINSGYTWIGFPRRKRSEKLTNRRRRSAFIL